MNIRCLFITCSLLLALEQAHSQVPDWEWTRSAKTITTGTGGGSVGFSVSLDPSGNIYIAGSFESGSVGLHSITFGSTTLVCNANDCPFLAKYDSSGNVLWAKSGIVTGASCCYGNGWGMRVSTDGLGNCYFTGFFDSTVTFGSHKLTTKGGHDIFLVKYDSSGNVIWAKSAGGNNTDGVYDIAVDQGGNAYITGYFESFPCMFGPYSVWRFENRGLYIAKYDSSGNALWAKTNSSGGGFAVLEGVAIDNVNGAVYATGLFGQSPWIVFGSDTIYQSSTLFSTGLLLKYDTTGNLTWIKSTSVNSVGAKLTTDKHGNVYLVGTYANTNPDHYASLTKYNSQGTSLWSKSYGVSGYNAIGFSVATDNYGRVLMTGSFDSPQINIGGILLQVPANSPDPSFIAGLDSSGKVLFAKALTSGGGTGNQGSQITTNAAGNLYIGSEFIRDSLFILGKDTLRLTGGYSNVFLAKLSYPGNTEWISKMNSQNNEPVLFPNPFSDKFKIHVSGNEPYVATLFDFTSRELLSQRFTGSVSFDTQTFTNGFYFLKIRNEKGGETFTCKVVKE